LKQTKAKNNKTWDLFGWEWKTHNLIIVCGKTYEEPYPEKRNNFIFYLVIQNKKVLSGFVHYSFDLSPTGSCQAFIDNNNTSNCFYIDNNSSIIVIKKAKMKNENKLLLSEVSPAALSTLF
jgi:hypothetical protein